MFPKDHKPVKVLMYENIIDIDEDTMQNVYIVKVRYTSYENKEWVYVYIIGHG